MITNQHIKLVYCVTSWNIQLLIGNKRNSKSNVLRNDIMTENEPASIKAAIKRIIPRRSVITFSCPIEILR